MGYLSEIVPGMEFATGILILPQRQTALVAKQAAEIDVLCAGRLRLGIGVRLERGRVRGAERGLPQPGRPQRRAGAGDARTLD